MRNQKEMNITLTRTQVCDLMMACTSLKAEFRREQREAETLEAENIARRSYTKWDKLHSELQNQLNAFDAAIDEDETEEESTMAELFKITRAANMKYREIIEREHTVDEELNQLDRCQRLLSLITEEDWNTEYSAWSERQELIEQGIIAG